MATQKAEKLFSDEQLDEWLKGRRTPEDVNALLKQLTKAVVEELRAWQNRPLDPFYGVIFLDALYVKMRHEGRVENRAIYVALGIRLDGSKEVLGLWTSANEGAKFWLNVLTELHNRGVKD